MSLHTRELDTAWNKLGMEIQHGRHVIAKLKVDGKLILTTGRSHGAGNLDGNIPHKIRGQMKLTKSQFDDAIACPLTRVGYLDILRSQGLIS